MQRATARKKLVQLCEDLDLLEAQVRGTLATLAALLEERNALAPKLRRLADKAARDGELDEGVARALHAEPWVLPAFDFPASEILDGAPLEHRSPVVDAWTDDELAEARGA